MRYTSSAALLGGVIDYAGTFPPAALPLEAALREAATCRTALKHPWIYSGRIALPVSVLSHLNSDDFFAAGPAGGPWNFTALASPQGDIEADLAELAAFQQRGLSAPTPFACVGYEVKLSSATRGNGFLTLLDSLEDNLPRSVSQVFFEAPPGQGWLDWLKEVADVLAARRPRFGAGIKVRTGGVQVPTAAELARAISYVREGVRFKATQGLHSAITHHGQFGFLNLFAALNLFVERGAGLFSEKEIAECLTCEDAGRFEFAESEFRWGAVQMDIRAIERARAMHGGVFGSCSLREPDDSLGELLKK